ncbi:MAG: DUF452 family protein [Vallitaleaceae bacterium]|jgi:biotin synthesis protein BioG|nr:DUF452 family protein [Vallitaleaceae bacterium]
MKANWINKQNNTNCILFFNGWGMDEHAIAHLALGDFDICMLSDYNPITSLEEELSKYNEVYLLAWSLGVWAASKVLSSLHIKFAKSIAINGTQNPIHDTEGIPTAIFNNTLHSWDDRNRKKFSMRMFGGRDLMETHQENLSNRNTQNQKDELAAIKDAVESSKIDALTFDVAVIGKNDLIFIADNQFNYWNNKTRVIEMDIPHFPFDSFTSWNEIIHL